MSVIVLEILAAIANVAAIAAFALSLRDRWAEYKHRKRMAKEDEKRGRSSD